MTLHIWKFPLEVTDLAVVRMSIAARVLCVQVQQDFPMLWALVDPDQPTEERRFRVIGTGHRIDDSLGAYVGTFQLANGRLVFHVFEAERAAAREGE
jgi:hypothetical protein